MLQPPKDVVAGAVYAKNCVEWVLCRAVCAVMGLRFSPINWHLVASEVAYIVHGPTEWLSHRVVEVFQDLCMSTITSVCHRGGQLI